MKILVLAVVMACVVSVFLPRAISQTSTTLDPWQDVKHLQIATPGSQGLPISFAALEMERSIDPQRQDSTLQLDGQVEIKAEVKRADSGAVRFVVRADQATYHQETGDIEVNGNVRVKLENVR